MMIQAGSVVKTPHGTGEVMKVREDGIVVCQFTTEKFCECCPNVWFGYFAMENVSEYGVVRSKAAVRRFEELDDECGGEMEEEEEFEAPVKKQRFHFPPPPPHNRFNQSSSSSTLEVSSL